jgi:phosphoribosylamine--glycine ligase
MKVLLVGSGGREHALAWQMAQSRLCDALYCAPGNPGTAECADNLAIAADDIDGIVKFAAANNIDLVVVGPEAPLVAGLADKLRTAGIPVFGPSQSAARIEGSKKFMKDLCAKYGIPTAAYGAFRDISEAKKFIRAQKLPVVVKADGLAAGKGVVIAQTYEEAEKAASDMLSGTAFGNAGKEVVIEEFLHGEEISAFALADGKDILQFASAQDHKRVGDGDTGPNTGGMGAYSPARMINPELWATIMDTIMRPTLAAMAAEGCPFNGVLFAGIMMVDGKPVLLEFNARFGDPECEAMMMRFDGDLLALLHACAVGKLADAADEIRWLTGATVCVVMAAKGYPGPVQKGTEIKNIGAADMQEETRIFHAGTALDGDGHLIASGGRVLAVTSRGDDVAQARARAYEAVSVIDWPGGFYRKDIGWRALSK